MNKPLFTISGLQISTGYIRIEHGGRGDYIEFNPSQTIWCNLYIPDYALERIGKPYYYLEYRTIRDNVKIYYQKRLVNYANYKIGMLYVSPKNILIKRTDILRFSKLK